LAEALNHKDEYVRRYVMDALVYVRHESAIPVFVKMLGDKDPKVHPHACAGLRELGPKAKEAVPVLTARIKDRKLLEPAIEALTAIAGKDAVPVILEVIERGKLSSDAEHSAASALAKFPDPRAAEFMGKLLSDRENPDVQVLAALFFSRLADEPSLARLRK